MMWRAAAFVMVACRAPAPTSALVEIRPADGPLQAQLASRRTEADQRGLRAFVQVYADWCGPCRALRGGMDDPRMKDAFEGTYVVRVELDAWKAQLDALVGSEGPGVPVLYAIEPDGRLGRSVSGRAWGEDTVDNMAPALKAYLRGEEPTSGALTRP